MEYDKSLHKYLTGLSATALQVSELLLSLKSHLSVAESCTGGLIAATCTSISGASDWFDTGVTTYTRPSKQGMLGLKDREIRDGLVSEATAIAMCEHVAKLIRLWAPSLDGSSMRMRDETPIAHSSPYRRSHYFAKSYRSIRRPQ